MVTKHDIPTLTGHNQVIGRSDRSPEQDMDLPRNSGVPRGPPEPGNVDLSSKKQFIIKNSKKIEQTIDTLSAISSEIIKNSFMFDFYENTKTNEFKIGYRFIFQSNSRTLTDIEVNKEIKRITDSVLLIDSVSLPGN